MMNLYEDQKGLRYEAKIGTHAAGQDFQKMVESVFATAKPPAEVAELVFAAIVNRRFWIQTDEFFRASIKARHRAIENDEDETVTAQHKKG